MTNQNTTTSNQELLSWAVENIKEWDEDYTHLRSDKSTNPVFYTTGYWHVIPRNIWDNPSKDGWRGQWCNLAGKLFSTATPQVITKEEWLEGVALLKHYDDGLVMDAPTSSPEPLQGHVHAEIMAEYALVAKTNPEPWKEFEVLNSEVKGWEELHTSPRWFADAQYRRKPTPPKTMNIGGIVVEAWPLDTAPKYKEEFYYVHLQDKFVVEELLWSGYGCGFCSQLELGRSFSTKEQAQAVADALNLVYNRALGKPEA